MTVWAPLHFLPGKKSNPEIKKKKKILKILSVFKEETNKSKPTFVQFKLHLIGRTTHQKINLTDKTANSKIYYRWN